MQLADRRLNISDIRKGRALAERDTAPDEQDIQEQARLEADRNLLKLQNQHLFLGLRRKYGNNIVRFLWIYSFVALALIVLDGFGAYGFDIPDSAVVALIGGAAASALGVVGTVAAGLFKPPPD